MSTRFKQLNPALTEMRNKGNTESVVAPGFWGPNSVFNQLAKNVCEEATPEELRGLSECLVSRLNNDGEKNRAIALTSIVRARRVGLATSEGQLLLQDACAAFTTATPAMDTSPTWANPAEAKHADPELFGDVGSALGESWTPGSWMAWDTLTQIHGSAQPTAEEKTWVLFASEKGVAMRLVLQASPGAPGLVTPNWWNLGLRAFHENNDNNFVVATQKAMQAVVNGASCRFRWHLESIPDSEWFLPVWGDSGTAAATLLAKALLERLDPKGRDARYAILDEHAAVTAVVNGTGSVLDDRSMSQVGEGTLATKFAAARQAGITKVLLAENQPGSFKDGEHPGLTIRKVQTVSDAYQKLKNVRNVIENYRRHTRLSFEYHTDASAATGGSV